MTLDETIAELQRLRVIVPGTTEVALNGRVSVRAIDRVEFEPMSGQVIIWSVPRPDLDQS